MRSRIYPLLLFIIVVASCRHKGYYELVRQPYASYKDVVYGDDAVQQSMDVYLPAGRDIEQTPVVIILHGGAWVQGDKGELNSIGFDTFFMAHGYAVINMNYRLDGTYQYPAPVDDIGLVMAYIKLKSGEWRINADRVCLAGKSVGAHLAMVYAYSRNDDKRVKAVMDFFGPSDLTDSTVVYKTLGLNVAYMLGAYSTHTGLWRDASPAYYMKGAVPTAIFQGTADSIVYYKQGALLNDSLQKNSVPSRFAKWEGKGHGWSQDEWVADRDAAIAWVNQFMK